MYKHAKYNKVVQFFLESGQVNTRHGIRPCMYWLHIVIKLQMHLFVWIYIDCSIKHLGILNQDLQQIRSNQVLRCMS
jgi:hypothetical protein